MDKEVPRQLAQSEWAFPTFLSPKRMEEFAGLVHLLKIFQHNRARVVSNSWGTPPTNGSLQFLVEWESFGTDIYSTSSK